jgi:hypothetical protein
MTEMSSLKRIVPIAGAFLLAGAMVGCGDDDGNGGDPPDAANPDGPPAVPPDAGVPDAGGGADACVGGQANGCTTDPFFLPERGEIRLEQFQTGPSGTGDEDTVAVQAFFYSGQDPVTRPGGKVMAIRPEIAAEGYLCVDYRDGNNSDNGKTPEAEAIVASREYIDIGPTVTITNAADDTDVITLQKFEGATDPAGATDGSAGLVHDIIYKGSSDTALDLGGQYKPTIAGTPDYPELVLKYGQSVIGDELADVNGDGEPLLYQPSDFQLTTPTEADYFAPAGLTFTKGQDFEIEYSIDNPETIGPGNYPTILPFIGLVSEGAVQVYCLKGHPGQLDDGTFKIPHEVFDIINQDPDAADETSYMVFGRFTRLSWEIHDLVEEVGQIQFYALTCMVAQDWVVNPAP